MTTPHDPLFDQAVDLARKLAPVLRALAKSDAERHPDSASVKASAALDEWLAAAVPAHEDIDHPVTRN